MLSTSRAEPTLPNNCLVSEQIFVSAVAGLKAEHDALAAHLAATEPSLSVGMRSSYAKSLVIAGASELEYELTKMIREFVLEATSSNDRVVSFVELKVLKRQYHTLFAWESRNANVFFSLFGADFRDYADSQVKADSWLREGVESFLEIGALRNALVHVNFAAFSLPKTVEEVFALYETAERFREAVPELLRMTYISRTIVNGTP